MSKISEKIQEDLSEKPDLHTRTQGYVQGASEFRDRLILDDVIEKALDKIDVATRLYPEVYTHAISEAVLSYIRALEDKPVSHTLIQFEPLDGVDYFYEGNELKVWGEHSEATEHARNMGFFGSGDHENYSEYLIQIDYDSNVDEYSIMKFLEHEVNTNNCEKLLETLRNTPGILVRGE